MPVVGRLDQYASMLAWEFDETTANNPSITGLGTYYSSGFDENVGFATTLTANIFPPYDPVYDEFGGTLFGAGQGRYMRQNTDKSVIVYNEIDEITDLFGRGIVRDGLVLDLDAGNTASYSGSGTTWTDLSSYGNTGTLTNGPTYSSANGGSIVFDGVNDYVENTSPNLGISGDASVTLSCWFYFTGTSSAGSYWSLLSYGNGPSALDTFALAIYDVYRLAFAFNGGNQAISNQNVITTNTWYNIVGTKTPGAINTTTNLYLNGSQISIASAPTGTPNVTSRVMRVGRWTNDGVGNEYYFTGRVANVQIYNRALTATEISQNYNALKGRFGL